MATLLETYPWLRSLWTVWFVSLFVGLVIWTMWPSRRAVWVKRGEIPLNDPHDVAAKDN
jgi:cbb3-type cytochrome oxidase subunit 3